MKCKKCGGEIDINRKASLCTSSGGVHVVETYHDAFPCTECGLLHWDDGEAVSNKSTGEMAYLENGEVVAKRAEMVPDAENLGEFLKNFVETMNICHDAALAQGDRELANEFEGYRDEFMSHGSDEPLDKERFLEIIRKGKEVLKPIVNS